MALEHEMAVYKLNLEELLDHDGKYIVIKGDDRAGIRDTYEEALTLGYERYGPVSFLVKKISRVEPSQYFSRDLR